MKGGKKLKVLFVIEQISVTYKYYENLVAELQKTESVRIEILNLVADDAVNSRLATFCERTYSLDKSRSYKNQVGKIRKIISESDPDIIHAHEVIPAFYAAFGLLTAFSSKKLIFHRHHSFYRNRATMMMEKIAFKRCDLAISVSDTSKAKALDEHPRSAIKIKRLYNGVTVKDTHESICFDHKKYEGYTKIVLLARLREGKGHLVGIDAVEIVKQKYPKTILLFAGEGGFRPVIEKHIHEKKMEENVMLLGDVKNIFQLMQHIDMAVLPSESEAFNLSILETMACNKLVIAKDLASIKECITDGFSGVLIQRNDPEELASKIIKYINETEERSRLAANGYTSFLENFTLPMMAQKLMSIYNELSA